MDRVAEEPFAGVLQQIGEEQRGRQLFELGFTRFPQAERLVLLLAAQFSEGFMIFVLTPRLGVGDPEVIDLFGHQDASICESYFLSFSVSILHIFLSISATKKIVYAYSIFLIN